MSINFCGDTNTMDNKLAIGKVLGKNLIDTSRKCNERFIFLFRKCNERSVI